MIILPLKKLINILLLVMYDRKNILNKFSFKWYPSLGV